MKPSSAVSSVLAVGLVAFAVPVFAQATPQNPDVLPAAGGNGPATDQPAQPAPAATSDTPKSTSNLGGSTYSDKPTRSAGATPRGSFRRTGPTVAMPGFEPTADGGTRFFVQLSQSVPVEERKANGSVTYVLKGASPRVWNNTNPLVTVMFNTPVSRARLVPSGKDLLFVLDLRAASAPTWKMNDGGTNGAQLTIDFAKGDFVTATNDELSAPVVEGGRPASSGTQQQTTTQQPQQQQPRARSGGGRRGGGGNRPR